MREAIARIKPTLLLLLSLALVAIPALSVSCIGQAVTYTDVTPEEASEMISQQEEVIVLDVRTQEEYNSGYIAGALLIPLAELESRLDELNPSEHILVYCHSGHRSREAAWVLVAHGFTHVYNLEGGIVQWQDEGFPIQGIPCG
jgi:rhodanese-related sulfurtransferase